MTAVTGETTTYKGWTDWAETSIGQLEELSHQMDRMCAQIAADEGDVSQIEAIRRWQEDIEAVVSGPADGGWRRHNAGAGRRGRASRGRIGEHPAQAVRRRGTRPARRLAAPLACVPGPAAEGDAGPGCGNQRDTARDRPEEPWPASQHRASPASCSAPAALT